MNALAHTSFLVFLAIGVFNFGAASAFAQQAQAPGQCEYGINSQAKNCSQRCDCGGASCGNTCDNRGFFYGNDASCAQSRIGIPTYTAKVTVFSDTKCAGGACNHSIAGIAHRTFPLGCYVEVCNLDKPNLPCSVAVVMDRGPNVCLPDRTIDANLKLKADLQLTGSNRASYKLLSCPGIAQKAEPSGPAEASLQALIAAQNDRNNIAGGPQPTYTAIQTPWGPGYLGTPPPIGSSAYNSMGGYGTQYGSSQQNSSIQTPISQLLGSPINSQAPAPAPTQGAGVPGPAASNIFVQPKNAIVGKNIYVSWTSVNMVAGSCIVRFDATEIATSNEGSQKIKITEIDSGTHEFTMTCVEKSGQSRTVRDTVTVQ